jgi:hypothetical protein
MGRSFVSTRQGVNGIADRWVRLAKKLRNRESNSGMKLAELARQHSSEGFVGCDDPLEAVIFSAVVEVLRNQDRIDQHPGSHVDP